MTLNSTRDNIKTLISGSAYFIEKECAKIADRLPDAEEHSYFADEIVPEEFFLTLFTSSLFSDSKAVYVHRMEDMKNPQGFCDELAKARDVSIILTVSDAKKTETMRKLTTPLGFGFLEEGRQSPASLTAEIKNIFDGNGLKITVQCAGQIGNLLNWDMSQAAGEAAKLSLYYAGKDDVPSQELLGHISGRIQETLFHFIDAFMEKQPDKCLRIYSQLPEIEDNASRIFYMLTSYLAGLYFKLKVPSLNSSSNPLFNGKTYFMRTVDNVSRRWEAEDAASMIESMSRLDLEVKTGRVTIPNALLLMIKQL